MAEKNIVIVSPDTPNIVEVIESNNIVEILNESTVPGSGSGTDAHFYHTQSVSSASWTIQHNLGKYPAVQVLDSSKKLVIGEVTHIDVNNLTISFKGAFKGSATLN